MRHRFGRLIPSMFKRRLLLLGVLGVCVTTALAGQIARLTADQGNAWKKRAEAVFLTNLRYTPTARGRIYDRHGRLLADDRPTYNVAVSYPVITGAWAYPQAISTARQADSERWSELDYTGREKLIAQIQPRFDAQLEQLWQVLCNLGGIEKTELDSRKAIVIERARGMASVVWDKRRSKRQANQPDESIRFSDVAQPISEQVANYAILEHVDGSALVQIRRLIAAAEGDHSVWRHVAVEPAKQRVYPYETMSVTLDESTLPATLARNGTRELLVMDLGRHIIGALRVWKNDVAWPRRRPFSTNDLGGYLHGDRIGYWGIERSREARLRGTRGRQAINILDRQEEPRIEPQRGNDVTLTIDIHLQARIRAVMDPEIGLTRGQPWHSRKPTGLLGRAHNGAAVVLDVNTGHVLAAVSMPGIDVRTLRENPTAIWNDQMNQPFLNRAVARPYQPGSIVKPFILAASFTDRKLELGERIKCTGAFDPDKPDRLRCWLYKHYDRTHEELEAPNAIEQSCNIFFYTLGQRLGPRRLVEWYRAFGLGQRNGCGLREEVAGDLPVEHDAGGAEARGLKLFDAILMGVGQGPIRVTVLQMANAYATLARGGYLLPPTFLKNVTVSRSEQSGQDLSLDPRGLAQVMDGLELVVTSPNGTAHHLIHGAEPIFNIEGVQIFGKSGTADAVPIRTDSNGDGRITGADNKIREGDHAWFVGLVQRPRSTRPDFAIAVVVEYAGSGGAVSGPIANQIMHALRAEGYL